MERYTRKVVDTTCPSSAISNRILPNRKSIPVGISKSLHDESVIWPVKFALKKRTATFNEAQRAY